MCNALQYIKRGGAYKNPMLNHRWTVPQIQELIDAEKSRTNYYRKISFLRKYQADLTAINYQFPDFVDRLPLTFDSSFNGINTKELIYLFILCAWQKAKGLGDVQPRQTRFIAELREQGWNSIRLALESSLLSTCSAQSLEELFENTCARYWAKHPPIIDIEPETIEVTPL